MSNSMQRPGSKSMTSANLERAVNKGELQAGEKTVGQVSSNPAVTTGMTGVAPSTGFTPEKTRAEREQSGPGVDLNKLEDENGRTIRKYQLLSAPATLQLSTGNKVCVEGVYATSDPKEIEELDAALQYGFITRYEPSLPKSQQQVPPVPANELYDKGNGIIQ